MRNIDIFTHMSALGFTNSGFERSEDSLLHDNSFDPELLYVECQACGKPIVWENGKTTALLLAAGVDITTLDTSCLIVSEGCSHCQPESIEGFNLAVIRLAGISAEEAAYLLRPGGNA